MINDQIMVSVAVLAYNHEKYIEKAIDSILNQECDFNYEILIGEDGSSDRTPEILNKYLEDYPDKIKVIWHDAPSGGTKNSYDIYSSAKGRYIAILEGDDYWCDRSKLRKQVQFLEEHQDYVGCCSDFSLVDRKGEDHPLALQNKIKRIMYFQGEVYSLNDLNQSVLPSQSSTLMFRNIFDGNDISIIYKASAYVGDFTVALLIASKGNIYRMKEALTCYRYNYEDGDSWTFRASEDITMRCGEFRYHTVLEQYAAEHLHVNYSGRNRKDEIYRLIYSFYAQIPYAPWEKVRDLMLQDQSESEREYYKKFENELKHSRNIAPTVYEFVQQGKDKMISDSLKHTWEELDGRIQGRKLVLYGAGDGLFEFHNCYYWKYQITHVVDSDLVKRGRRKYGYQIISFEDFTAEYDKDCLVLITTGIYANEIALKLEEAGYHNIYCFQYMESQKENLRQERNIW